MNTMSRDQQITAELAYGYWQAEGCPSSRELDHWLRAEQDLKDKSQTPKAPDKNAKGREPTATRAKKA